MFVNKNFRCELEGAEIYQYKDPLCCSYLQLEVLNKWKKLHNDDVKLKQKSLL